MKIGVSFTPRLATISPSPSIMDPYYICCVLLYNIIVSLSCCQHCTHPNLGSTSGSETIPLTLARAVWGNWDWDSAKANWTPVRSTPGTVVGSLLEMAPAVLFMNSRPWPASNCVRNCLSAGLSRGNWQPNLPIIFFILYSFLLWLWDEVVPPKVKGYVFLGLLLW